MGLGMAINPIQQKRRIPFQVSRASLESNALITNLTMAIPSVATTVNLTADSERIIIHVLSGSAIVYVSFNSLAASTTNGFAIEPGNTFEYDGLSINSFSLIGASASGNVSILAY